MPFLAKIKKLFRTRAFARFLIKKNVYTYLYQISLVSFKYLHNNDCLDLHCNCLKKGKVIFEQIMNWFYYNNFEQKFFSSQNHPRIYLKVRIKNGSDNSLVSIVRGCFPWPGLPGKLGGNFSALSKSRSILF